MSDNEQVELTQVAAVAAASMEDAEYGVADFEGWCDSADGGPAIQGLEVLDAVAAERMRQDEKWGPQTHSRPIWAMILAEEIGEWAEELGTVQEGGDVAPYEATQIRAVLGYLRTAGIAARSLLEAHVWPVGSKNQEVFDAELVDEADPPAVVPGTE